MKNDIKIMGILNITPDSFYDGKDNLTINSHRACLENIKDADIIDVGCESSRPGAKEVSYEEEIHRLNSFIPLIQEYPDKIFSIDTYKFEVMKHALSNGFSMVNDIKAGRSSNEIFNFVAEQDCKIVLMHMQGSPETMQINPKYDSIIDTIISFFEERVNEAIKYGIKEKNIILDPGIGFGKTIENNDDIIRNIKHIKKMGFDILMGISRKSFLQYKNDKPSDRLPATLGVTAIMAKMGVDIIRVHDVKDTISMLNSVLRIVE